MSQNNWYVITGGPSSGKTTLINELTRQGFKTVPESARTFIDQQLARGKKIEQIRADEEKFQHQVLGLKIQTESALSSDETIIFDRGMHDTEAYLRYYDFPVSSELQKTFGTANYKKVFILEMLPEFQTDYARTENQEFANKITGLLGTAYKNAGFVVTSVPVLPLKDRAEFICGHIQQAV